MASEATTRTGSTVKQGLDVEQYKAFIEFVRENPGAVEGELRAVGEYEGTAYHTATRFGPFVMGGENGGASRDYTLHVGVPGEFEANVGFVEPVDRMESVEVALGALTTCITNTISQAALVEGIDVEHITTSVSVPIDLRVLLGVLPAEERETLIGQPEIDIEIEGRGLGKADRERLTAMVEQSPMYSLVTLAHPTEPTVTVRKGA